MLDLDETFDEFIDESLLFKKQQQQKQSIHEKEPNKSSSSSSSIINENATKNIPKLKANFQNAQNQINSEQASASVLIDDEQTTQTTQNNNEASVAPASIPNKRPIIASNSSQLNDSSTNAHKSHNSGLLRKRTSNTLTGLSSKLFPAHHSAIKSSSKSPRCANPETKSN
jgi:hypothetical protein